MRELLYKKGEKYMKYNMLKKMVICSTVCLLFTTALSSCDNKVERITDINQITSDKVSNQDEWKACFDTSKYTNFTMLADGNTLGSITKVEYKYTTDKVYYSSIITQPNNLTSSSSASTTTSTTENYFSKVSDTKWNGYSVTTINGTTTDQNFEIDPTNETYKEFVDGSYATSSISNIPSQASFDKVTYSDEKKGYVYQTTMSIMDGVSATGQVVIKIKNGMCVGSSSYVDYSILGISYKMEANMVFYDIGSTSITLPESMTK